MSKGNHVFKSVVALPLLAIAAMLGAVLPANSALAAISLEHPSYILPKISTSFLEMANAISIFGDNGIDQAGILVQLQPSVLADYNATQYVVMIREAGTSDWHPAQYAIENEDIRTGSDASFSRAESSRAFIWRYHNGVAPVYLTPDTIYDVGVTVKDAPAGVAATVQRITYASDALGQDLYATTPFMDEITVNPETSALSVSWHVPTYSGLTPISGYRITAVGPTGSATKTVAPTATSADFTDLLPFADDEMYSLSVVAVNGVDGPSTNFAYRRFVYNAPTATTPASVGAPDTGFKLNLMNPAAVAGVGGSAAVILFGIARYMRRQG